MMRDMSQSTPETRGARAKALIALAKKITMTEDETGEEFPSNRIDDLLAPIGASRGDLAPYIEAFNENPVWNVALHSPSTTREWEEEAIFAFNAERAATDRTNDALAMLSTDGDTDWAALAHLLDIPEDALRARASKPRGSKLDAPGVVTIAQAARLLNTPRTTVAHWVKTGRVKSTETRGRTMVVLDAEGQPFIVQ